MKYLFDFSNDEYADITFAYGWCTGNAGNVMREYRIRFPYRRRSTQYVFRTSFRRLRMTGTAMPLL